jgi:putative endonuclease
MYHVYILYSQNIDRFYIGHTSNVLKRLPEHNNPQDFSKYSAKGIPWVVVLSIMISDSRSDAMRVERFIKKQKSRAFIQKLILEKDNLEYFEKLICNILK